MSQARPVVAAVAVAVSLGMLGLGIPGVLGAQADASLVPVEGTVLEVQSKRSLLLVRGTSANSPSHETSVHVRYRYAFESVEYTGNRYAFDEPHEGITDEDEARARVEELRAGSSLTVLVDPGAPERAALARRELGPPLVFTLLGSLALFGGLGWLVRWGIARRTKTRFEHQATGGHISARPPEALTKPETKSE